jgi:hypothetical protein
VGRRQQAQAFWVGKTPEKEKEGLDVEYIVDIVFVFVQGFRFRLAASSRSSLNWLECFRSLKLARNKAEECRLRNILALVSKLKMIPKQLNHLDERMKVG